MAGYASWDGVLKHIKRLLCREIDPRRLATHLLPESLDVGGDEWNERPAVVLYQQVSPITDCPVEGLHISECALLPHHNPGRRCLRDRASG